MEMAYILTCEDASHLGGPMGTEYTTLLWDKVFKTEEGAKRYAAKYAKRTARWETSGDKFSWDSGAYIFTLRLTKILS